MKNLMNKLLALLLILSAATSTLFAQWEVGIRGGINTSNIRQTDLLETITPDLHDVTGPNISLLATHHLGTHFAIQTELGLATKGFGLGLGKDVNLFGVSLPIGANAESRFNYLEVPVLAKGKIGNEKISAFALLGPSVSYAASGRVVTESTGLIQLDLANTRLDLGALGMQRWDIGAVAGAGIEWHTPFGKVFMDGRFQQGFNQIYDIPVSQEKAQNRSFSLGAGLTFNI